MRANSRSFAVTKVQPRDERVRGDEEIVRANETSLFLQICSYYSVGSIRWRLKGLYDESLKSFFNASFEFEGCIFRYAEA